MKDIELYWLEYAIEQERKKTMEQHVIDFLNREQDRQVLKELGL